MRRKIEREVEGRNKGTGANRHALPDALIAPGARGDVKRLDLARHPDGLFCGDPEGIDQATDLSLAVLDRLAGLHAERKGKLVEPFPETADTVHEHVLPLITCHPRHRFCGLDRPLDARIDRLCVGLCAAERDLAGELVRDLKVGVGLLRLVVEVKRINVLEHVHSFALRSLMSRLRILSLSE